MHSLLSKVTAADIREAPFPHIVIPDVMDPETYTALADSFPGFGRIAWASSSTPVPSNRRFALPAKLILEAPDLPDCWKSFAAIHSSQDFLGEVERLFKGYWDPAMLASLNGRFTGHRWERLDLTTAGTDEIFVRQDARIELNTPVRDKPSSARGPHLDTPNRLYSGLFYMRAPEDDSEGGDLALYRWRNGRPSRNITAYIQPEDEVEEVARIPYRANQLVMFPQGINALHGVGVRNPTPHTRRYVFITAEISQDWLQGPEET